MALARYHRERVRPFAYLSGYTLIIRGTDGDDTIRIVGVSETGPGGILPQVSEVRLNDERIRFPWFEVTRAVVWGGGGNDDVAIGNAGTIYGGAGNDRITGGDEVFAGPGDDTIFARSPDRLHPGRRRPG